MPSMERSVSCAERGTAYGGGAAADLRSYSASYAPRLPPSKMMNRAQSTASSAWTRPSPAQPAGAVRRSGSTKSSFAGGPTPGLNLRCYSASYAASSYGLAALDDGAAAGGRGQMKRSGSVTNWSASGRRSVNLRGYTPSFSALDDTAAAPPAVPASRKQASSSSVGGGIDDAELRRKKRLVVYKAYDVEGKLRSSVRRGVGWIKSRCSRVVHGWW